MIAYATLGTNDMDRAITFFDAVLAPIGCQREETSANWTRYGRPGERPKMCLTTPFNHQSAAGGNGAMLAFETASHAAVDAFHAAALAHGGTDEGTPGIREGTHYVAYVRDPDGNKLCVFAPK
ncbi:MAG: VOC family protein [Erythrobacter sp.]